MRTFIFFTTALIISVINPEYVQAHDTAQDTVVIELSSKSKIVIYTEDREALKNLEHYDFNRMIKDLNSALSSKKIQKIELQDKDGNKYLKDTTIVLGDGHAKTKIKIGNMELLVDTDDWEEELDEDLPITKYTYEEKRTDRTRHRFNIDIGLTNWMEGGVFPDANGAAYTVKPWASWYIGLNSVNKTWLAGPLFLEWGAGVNWFNWKMENSDIVIAKGEERVEFNERTPEVNSIKSRLTASYINVTLVPMLDFAQGKRKVNNYERGGVTFKTYKKQGIRVGIGGYAGYRLGSQSRFVYKEDGHKEKDKEHSNFFLENFRYGLRAQVGFKGLDLFAAYDLNNVFSDNRGPANSSGLNAISFGITL